MGRKDLLELPSDNSEKTLLTLSVQCLMERVVLLVNDGKGGPGGP